jgi:23S rRNA (uridine2552-2'-O)-methyltransferase
MSKRNYNRKDQLHQQAKSDGFRSRAAYKLLELQKRYGLLHNGDVVLDIGCWPGGWLQVAAQIVGTKGLVAGIDITATDPLPQNNIFIFKGDITDENYRSQFFAEISARRCPPPAPDANQKVTFDSILSDASPKLSGIAEVDEARCADLAHLALEIVHKSLKAKGNFVIKLFKNNEASRFTTECSRWFQNTKAAELDSSRTTSKEFYLVARGFRGGK